MAEKVFKMTAEGKAQLEAELDSLKTEGRIDIAEKLKVARSYGDLSENSEYDEAKSEQAKIEARINELEYQLEHAEIIGATEKGSVSMGSKVTVLRKSDDVRATYEIVGFSQSNPAEGKISDESPVGRALMGAKIGETVTVKRLHGEGAIKRRIMDMGITKGAEVYVRKVAPLGDPIELTVRGYELSLRKADAEKIEVE